MLVLQNLAELKICHRIFRRNLNKGLQGFSRLVKLLLAGLNSSQPEQNHPGIRLYIQIVLQILRSTQLRIVNRKIITTGIIWQDHSIIRRSGNTSTCAEQQKCRD
jgi:hypothetical protein